MWDVRDSRRLAFSACCRSRRSSSDGWWRAVCRGPSVSCAHPAWPRAARSDGVRIVPGGRAAGTASPPARRPAASPGASPAVPRH